MRPFFANIYYLCLIKLSKWLMLIMPVVVLFYNDNGLDTYKSYLLQAGYSISVALFAGPTSHRLWHCAGGRIACCNHLYAPPPEFHRP